LDDFKSGCVLLEDFQKRINCSLETYLVFKKPARSALGGFQKLYRLSKALDKLKSYCHQRAKNLSYQENISGSCKNYGHLLDSPNKDLSQYHF
jgi:hypothetical protein